TVAKAAERNPDLDLVPPLLDVSLRLPDEVRAQVVLPRADIRTGDEAPSFAPRAVGLDAERIDDENEGAIALVERVEVNLHIVVGADSVPVGHRRGNGAVRLVGSNAEVDRVRRVPHPDVRRVRGGP